jgi:tRNA (cmo5U34)-methyltransferase
MSEFKNSEWAKREAAHEFIDNADQYIVERGRMFRIMQSYYRHFIQPAIPQRNRKVLDLGCGDGRVMYELLQIDPTIEGTLLDGSADMLAQAKTRLQEYHALHYIQATFQDLLHQDALSATFDFVISALAIHHLDLEEKKRLFTVIYRHLEANGSFLNIDVMLSPTEPLEHWYLDLWKTWIAEQASKFGHSSQYEGIPQQYDHNPDNLPDTLADQLHALREIGFTQVDCYYKYGIFAVYGGQK